MSGPRTGRKPRAQAIRLTEAGGRRPRSVLPVVALAFVALVTLAAGRLFGAAYGGGPLEGRAPPAGLAVLPSPSPAATAPSLASTSTPTPTPRAGPTATPSPTVQPAPALTSAPAPAPTLAPTLAPTPAPSPAPPAAPPPGPAAAPTVVACEYGRGFREIANALGPQVVGECLENERVNGTNGNGEQRTARGMLVWIKTDNVTAFTNGPTTWYYCLRGIVPQASQQPTPC